MDYERWFYIMAGAMVAILGMFPRWSDGISSMTVLGLLIMVLGHITFIYNKLEFKTVK